MIFDLFQAKLPPDARSSVGEEKDRDELLFRPGQIDGEKQDKYVKLVLLFFFLKFTY